MELIFTNKKKVSIFFFFFNSKVISIIYLKPLMGGFDE
tara:strand:+ start:3481 stop:3594 length:114 start_codon:yes stop_codon:yes gene_type:complete